jgi:hypothetical protein
LCIDLLDRCTWSLVYLVCVPNSFLVLVTCAATISTILVHAVSVFLFILASSFAVSFLSRFIYCDLFWTSVCNFRDSSCLSFSLSALSWLVEVSANFSFSLFSSAFSFSQTAFNFNLNFQIQMSAFNLKLLFANMSPCLFEPELSA